MNPVRPNVRPVSDWQRMWWFPFIWRRRIGWFLSTAPNVLVDINSFWWEYSFDPVPSTEDQP